MSGFTAAAFDVLDFDFTGIPRADAEGNCTAKGIVPEPSEERFDAFVVTWNKLRAQAKAAQEGDGEPPQGSDARAAVAALCSGTPTLEEIQQLPYRAFGAFAQWLLGEMAPKG